MCRRNQLLGCVLLAFGLGTLFGYWLGQGFLCMCIGCGMLALGFCVLKRK